MTACRCGSGLDRYELCDSAGIFCSYVCDQCEQRVRRRYNPAIFEGGRYASTGDEQDIGYEQDMDGE